MRSHKLQLFHKSTEATHLVPFFVYLLQSLTQTYIPVSKWLEEHDDFWRFCRCVNHHVLNMSSRDEKHTG